MLKTALGPALGLLLAAAPLRDSLPRGAGLFDAEDVIARSRSTYAALQSYADRGTVVDERAGFENRSVFRTSFTRDPRNFFLEFQATESVGRNGFRIPLNARTVFWMQQGELQKWDEKAGTHDTYPADGGGQVDALKSASYGTAGISVLIPSHLYTKSGMASPLHAMEEAAADGYETIGGRRCFKVMGIERWRYPSGRVTGVRPITVWIDAETYLIRKILEDTPKGVARGVIDRRIITLEPSPNPRLEASVFRYAVPPQ